MKPEYLIIMVLLAAAIGIYYVISGKRNLNDATDQKAEELEEKYCEITPQMIAEIPDDELVTAIIANLLSQLDEHKPDAYSLIPGLSRGRCAVYSVWLVYNELKTKSIVEYLAGYTAEFAELAADGFELVGAPGCADALRGTMSANSTEVDDLDQAYQDFQELYDRTAAESDPLVLCRDYIRANPDDFSDYLPLENDEELPRESDYVLLEDDEFMPETEEVWKNVK